MLRKVMLVILAGIMVFGLIGCGKDATNSNNPTASLGVSVFPTEDGNGSSAPTDSGAATVKPTTGAVSTTNPTKTPSATKTPTSTATPKPIVGGTIYQLVDESQMMSYVIQTQSNKLMILDGGYGRNKDDIIDLAKEITGQAVPEIEAWFFSHTHSDHVNAFSELVNEGNGKLKIKKLYYSLLTRNYVVKNEEASLETYDNFVKALGKFPDSSKVSVQQGDVITVDGLEMQVMLIPDEKATMLVGGVAVNESSVIYRLTIGGQRVMFLGDAYQVAGSRLRKAWNHDITADVVQMAHHGSQGVQFALYKMIAPKACLWPTPEWLWNNDPGTGYNTGNWETIKLHAYMKDTCGVKHHFVAKDGVQKLVFPLDLS